MNNSEITLYTRGLLHPFPDFMVAAGEAVKLTLENPGDPRPAT